jgi:hypothetical protein
MPLITYIPGSLPPVVRDDVPIDDMDLYTIVVYYCVNNTCSGVGFVGTWQEVNDHFFAEIVNGDGHQTMQVCQNFCAQNACEHMNITATQTAPATTTSPSGEITVSISWLYTQGQSVIQNVPIHLYDSSGNIIQTATVDPPEVFTFTGLQGGVYSVGPASSFSYDFNGTTVSISDCSVSVPLKVKVEDDTILGCMDPLSCSYNIDANVEDGSCLYEDCKGDCGGPSYIDKCGDCVTTENEGCKQDCNNEYGGAGVVDDCGECNDPLSEAWNQACIDCAGTPN